MEEAVARCDDLIRAGAPAQVVTPNAEIIMAAQGLRDLHDIINRSALSIPDGAGLLLAGRILGTPLREQVTGTDLSYRLAALAAERGYRLFLLGAADGVADDAARRLEALNPQLRIAGTFAGWSRPGGDAETRAVIAAAGQVDVVLVAYGAPWQERWIARNQAALGIPLAIGVGGVFDFMSGRTRRAPAWLRRVGLDWAFRLALQPSRFYRQLALPRFVGRVVLTRIKAMTRAPRTAPPKR
jgi:N-acetylglucosaminyldiphosphoundecaprenol N-acetyl-beta-D-mannosaminyltransferase